MASYYIKLDVDWYEDPKILEFADLYGKAALVDVIKLFCVISEFFGEVDLNERAQLLRVQKVMGKKGKALDTFLARCAGVDLIRADMLESFSKVCSNRSLRDGRVRWARRQNALDASAAAKDAREQKKNGGSDDGEDVDREQRMGLV